MGKCAQHASEYRAVVIGIQFPDKNGGYKDYFLQWAEHCLNTIVDRCGNRVFNVFLFDLRREAAGSRERRISASKRLCFIRFLC